MNRVVVNNMYFRQLSLHNKLANGITKRHWKILGTSAIIGTSIVLITCSPFGYTIHHQYYIITAVGNPIIGYLG